MPITTKGTPYVVSTDLVANYPTVSSDLADHIDDNLQYNAQDINAQTGSGANAYTFVLADASLYKLVTASNAAAATYTVPPQSSVIWATGAVLRILNQGAGVVTLAGGSGVTLNGSVLTLNQYQYAEIHRTASNAWTVVGIATPPGLVKITAQTFSAVTAVNVNDCFSSTYDNYRITLRLDPLASGNQVIDWRLRVSGADNTTASYGYTTNYGYISNNISGFEVNLGNTSTAFGRFLSHSSAGGSAGYVDIFSPNLTAQTFAVGNSLEFDATGALRMTKGWRFSGTTVFTGFSLISGSNMAGLVTVYGFQK